MKHKRGVISIALATIVLVSLCAVVCSTSVTAADSSRTTVQAPATVGAALNSAPAAAIWKKAGTGDNWPPAVSVKSSTDNQPYFKDFDAGQTAAWVALGGATSAAPSIASGTPTQAVVSVRGNNAAGNLYWKETTDKGTTWLPGATGWNKVPTGEILAGTSPATYSFGENSIGWLVVGNDKALYWMTWDNVAGYSSWEKLGGVVTATPAVVTRGNNIDVYVRGNNGDSGHIYQTSYIAAYNKWTPYAERTTAVNVKAGTAPTVSAFSTTREDLFWQGTDGLLYQSTWPNGADTMSWTAAATVATNVPAPGTTLASSPSAVAGTFNGAIDIEVCFAGGNGHLWVTEYYTTTVGTAPTWQGTIDFGDGPP